MQVDRTVAAQSINLGMSTVMTLRAFGKHAEESLSAVRDEVVRLENLLSRYLPGSEISRINRSAGMTCDMVSDDTYGLKECFQAGEGIIPNFLSEMEGEDYNEKES